MKKAYWLVAYRSISDEAAVKAYGELAVPALKSFGARFDFVSLNEPTK